MNRKAMVTLAIGADYLARWQRCCERGWRAYAKRHGYDLLVWGAPLDNGDRARKRSAAWQKCLVPGREEVARYDRVLWLDADIIVNPNAPDICDGVPLDAIGATDEHAFPTLELHQQIVRNFVDGFTRAGRPDIAELWRCFLSPQRYYESWGLPAVFSHIVQTGVLIFSPDLHRHIFEFVYARYEDKGGPAWNHEMRPLSYEIQKASRVYWLDQNFDALLPFLWSLAQQQGKSIHGFLRDAMSKYHMSHFAGMQAWMDQVQEFNPACAASSTS
jgi:hypothetical protein